MDHVPPSTSIQCVNFSQLANLLDPSASRGQSSRSSTNRRPSASGPSKRPRLATDLYTETYTTRGAKVYYSAQMHQSDEDFAKWLKETDEVSITAGLARNNETRQQRLNDSPDTHMTKPGPGGRPIELPTHHARLEYYQGAIFSFCLPNFLDAS
jgi:hypothetical protein